MQLVSVLENLPITHLIEPLTKLEELMCQDEDPHHLDSSFEISSIVVDYSVIITIVVIVMAKLRHQLIPK